MNKPENFVSLRGHHLSLLHGYAFLGREEAIRSKAAEDHCCQHADHMIDVLKTIAEANPWVLITDMPDDICKTCDDRFSKECSEFIPYGESLASADRATAHNVGLKRDVFYRASQIFAKLKDVGSWIR
jgi:hypothetical protein